MIYVVDPHPLQPDPSPYRGSAWMLPYSKYRQARTFDERATNAATVAAEPAAHGLFDASLVDWLTPRNASGNNEAWCTWGPAPNSAWLVAKNGTVRLAQSWLDEQEMNASMTAARHGSDDPPGA